MDYERLDRALGGMTVMRDAGLAPWTTFRIGGPADRLLIARTAEQMVTAISACRELGIPFFVLGRGANILVGDDGYRGLVIRCAIDGIEFLDDRRVRAGSGVDTFHDLIDATVACGLGGLEHYVGIPSTVGGALWQNLHFLSPPPARERTCFIAEVLEAAEILTAWGELRTVDNAWFRFAYDYSALHDGADVVLNATFRLEPTPRDQLRYVIRENLAWRDERHPDLWLYPCAGSIFKKIDGIGAGRLIDECGLKGRVMGNAAIFRKHANIIVNLGGATAAEVRALMDEAREIVLKRTGHTLEPEILMVGDFT
jgi:UDP-N-acetylmuramate dehydrogenase